MLPAVSFNIITVKDLSAARFRSAPRNKSVRAVRASGADSREPLDAQTSQNICTSAPMVVDSASLGRTTPTLPAVTTDAEDVGGSAQGMSGSRGAVHGSPPSATGASGVAKAAVHRRRSVLWWRRLVLVSRKYADGNGAMPAALPPRALPRLAAASGVGMLDSVEVATGAWAAAAADAGAAA